MISINFKNIQHALATFFKTVVADTPVVLAKTESVVEGIVAHKAEIEVVSGVAAAIASPAAAQATVTIEDAGFAALGSLDAALKAGGAAAEQNLLNAGVDQAAIDAVKAVGVQSTAVYTLLKSSIPTPVSPTK